jgi:hypothetical protein
MGAFDLGEFYGALQTRLASDATLVSMTAHSESAPGIFREMPEFKERVPCLTFYCDSTTQFIEDSNVPVASSLVHFDCWTNVPTSSITMADRLCELLINGGDTGCWQGTVSIDITNANVKNFEVRFRSRDNLDFNSEYDVWGTNVIAEFRWLNL